MKKLALYSIVIFLITTTLQVNSQSKEYYSLEKKIAIPGDGGYDYLAIDTLNDKLYISHGTEVNILDLKTELLVGSVKDMKGVHGIAIDNSLNRGFISDGKANSIIAFDLKTFEKIETIPVSGIGPDAIMYDSYTGNVFSFNGESKNASVISSKSLKQIGTVDLGGGPEFAISDHKGKIYNNIEDLNTIKIIDAKSLKIISEISLEPAGTPTGLGADFKFGRLFSGCRKNKGLSIVDISTGKVILTLPIGAGVDAVAFDPSTSIIFASCGDGTTTLIRQGPNNEYSIIQTLKTEPRAKTMALDIKTHKIYLSVPEFETGTRKIIPGSFHLLVYKMN